MISLINTQIVQYVEERILPQYNSFDKAHDLSHVQKVIKNSLQIAQDYSIDLNMVYVIAAYHDIGLKEGRKNHEKSSGVFLLADKNLERWFSGDDMETMKQAVEDHRASSDHEPRSIYGKIVAEADRDIFYEVILRRTIQYGLKQFPHHTMEEQFERMYDHILTKYGEGGYIKLWLNTKKNTEGLAQLRRALQSKETMRADFDRLFMDIQR